MGYVKAGEMLDENGELILEFVDRPLPRELCGNCGERFRWTPEGTLVTRSLEELDWATGITE
jgi:hypothetical protein